ncbi:MAG: hypothetical protein K8S54_20175 [Spirochaetia bacterium]|nr:hypothetical protein [Spirochaetia bacterium]
MLRKALLTLLALSAIIEFVMAIGGFLMPDFARQQFKIGTTDDTRFLTFVTAWFILLIGIFCAYAWLQTFRGKGSGYVMTNILGLWWVGIGIGIYYFSGGHRPDNLVLDSAKGALLVLLNYLNYRFG